MSRQLVARADRALEQVRCRGRTVRARLRGSNPLLWLGGGALAGAVAARVAKARRRGERPATFALLVGLLEGHALRALAPWLAPSRGTNDEDTR